jgi:hypothetical protein
MFKIETPDELINKVIILKELGILDDEETSAPE